jgi:aryl-alcohol dehydrogenase-like predicted oxidoreductase
MDQATAEGTRDFISKLGKSFPQSAYRPLGNTGCLVSNVGFGTYRVDDRSPEHAAALDQALRAGCNLIDTSTNYTDGSSERCVGRIVEQLIKEGVVRRPQIVLVSKVGYVQGENLEFAQAKEADGSGYPEMVKYAEECWHNIHPDFISDQLTQSLDRTQQSCIDVYLLHNPEYFFSDAQKRRKRDQVETLREEFYRRISAAFTQLEREVKRGRIGWYGVSSNTFGASLDDPEAVSLTKLYEIAESVADEHHFAVVQCPLNLFEGGVALTPNNGADHRQTFLEFASAKRLGVLVNRPINAIFGNQILRLADFVVEDELSSAVQLTKVYSLEQEFEKTIAPYVQLNDPGVEPRDLFRWSQELGSPELQNVPLEHWQQIEMQMVRPQVVSVVNFLNSSLGGEVKEIWNQWRPRYIPELEKLLQSMRNESAKRSQKISDTVSKRIENFLPASARKNTLSQKSISILINTAGVTSVLNGMRQTRYVSDSMGAMKMEFFNVENRLYESLKLR